MRILFIVPYVPSLVRTRPYNLIRALSARGHEVTVVTPWFVSVERNEVEALRAHCSRVIARPLSRRRRIWNRACAVATLRPTQATLCWIPELSRRADAERFDVVHVEHLRASLYGLRLMSRSAQMGSRVPVVWDSVDSLHLLMRCALAQHRAGLLPLRLGWDAMLMGRCEARLLSRFRHVTVTSPIDRDALLGLCRGARPTLTVIPNGVDLDYFHPGGEAKREPEEIVMTGKMSYHANVAMAVHFVEHVFPRIRARRPTASLRIVGQGPPARVRDLGRRPGISVTGRVDDIRPYLWRAAIAVTPTPYGVGIQNKVLEAMACATPVVGSPQSISALRAQAGDEVVVARQPEEFALRCLELLDSDQARERLGRAGRRYVEREHEWSQAAERFEEIYQNAIAAD